MNITIDVNLKASEAVTNSLSILAAVLQNEVPTYNESANIMDAKKEERKAVQAVLENPKEEVKETTLEEVRNVLAKLWNDGKQQEVKSLINKFKGKKLTDIPEEKYKELLKEANSIAGNDLKTI